MFCCSWIACLEQLTYQSARQGSQLHRIQKTTENIHVSDGLRRIVIFELLHIINLLTYLLTYLYLGSSVTNCREILHDGTCVSRMCLFPFSGRYPQWLPKYKILGLKFRHLAGMHIADTLVLLLTYYKSMKMLWCVTGTRRPLIRCTYS